MHTPPFWYNREREIVRSVHGSFTFIFNQIGQTNILKLNPNVL